VLLRRRSQANLVWYESPLLAAAGIPHAFSTRLGGVSIPPFDSLNFGQPAGDVRDLAENIEENYRRLQSAIDAEGRRILKVHQIHGPCVLTARVGEPWENLKYADAIVADDPGALASVRIADCVPVLLAAADGRAVAAVHAGWRGVVAGVVPLAAIELRKIAGDVPILAAIGPCIGFDAFEVGPEVLAAFQTLLGDQAPIRQAPENKGRVDLKRAITIQLERAGLPDSQIDCTDRCTFRDAGEFFSHRRDKGVTGRMVALIGPRR
jgi:polyphenol oxidase